MESHPGKYKKNFPLSTPTQDIFKSIEEYVKKWGKKAARAETYALTDVRANDVDSVRIALEAAGYKVRPYQHKFHGHYVAMVEVEGDPKGIAKVMFPWIRKGEAQRVKGRVKDHFKAKAAQTIGK